MTFSGRRDWNWAKWTIWEGLESPMQTTTAFELSGFRILRSLGVVRGITVRTRALPLSIVGGLRTLFGGRAGIFSDLCESAREESFQLMISHARKMGANAVVGMFATIPARWWAPPSSVLWNGRDRRSARIPRPMGVRPWRAAAAAAAIVCSFAAPRFLGKEPPLLTLTRSTSGIPPLSRPTRRQHSDIHPKRL